MNKCMGESWKQLYISANKEKLMKVFFPTINKRMSCPHFIQMTICHSVLLIIDTFKVISSDLIWVA